MNFKNVSETSIIVTMFHFTYTELPNWKLFKWRAKWADVVENHKLKMLVKKLLIPKFPNRDLIRN